ncbi:MAG: hypothetical protein DRG78_02765 [Epsilonproteobacteria bacterium]|nr:MAG: hypothetical protein DRG78_02765 [Campylobacterota bacterium]
MMNKNEIQQLVEPHFYNDLKEDNYKIETIKSNVLLTNARLDIAFKLLYLEILDKDVSFAKDIYTKHISAFSLGAFNEPGNDDKNSIDKFIEDFKKTFEDIKCNGFDATKTLIPLSQNSSIANGAHRVASAIYLDKEINCVEIKTSNHIYDYDFFYNRNISSDILDTVVTTFIKYASNVHIAFLWPIKKDNNIDIETIIPNIVYKKKIKLNPNGAHNLLSQIYYGEEWLGNIENNFNGVNGKLVECFKTFDSFDVIAFQADSLDEVLKIKENIREVFNVGKHSVHITDTKEEAIRTARVVFNDNSLHFLNYAKPNKYISTHKKIDIFKEFMKENNLDSKDLIIDSSFILSCYGLREAKDTDFFCSDNSKIKVEFKDINIHDEELKYYEEEKNELIYDPKNYFYFNDIKFISFNQLYKMKTNRAEEKDKNDCDMMEALIEDNKVKEFIGKMKQNILYLKIRIRANLMIVLKSIGLYTIIKGIVRGNK